MLPAAAATLTVAQAIGSQSGTGTVRGYVVGEPTATSTVRSSNFTGDTALAIADSSSQTSTASMLYVQITSAYRSAFGLLSNPSLIAYADHGDRDADARTSRTPGLKSPTAMTNGHRHPDHPPTTGTPTPTASSSTDAYYAPRSASPAPASRPRCTPSSPAA